MSVDRSADYIGHMLEAAKLAHGYIDGLDKIDFFG
jgi:hypothetical protein